MGRFHRHDDGTEHSHDDDAQAHSHADLGDHSGYETGTERVQVLERIFDENDRLAAANRADLAKHGVRAINLMSSPGAGKTTLLVETLRRLQGSLKVAIIEGDIETSLDADRLAGLGAEIALINTGNGFGGECHLDAPMVRSALGRVPLDEIDVLFIENVGNLVCPAAFDLGEQHKVAILSIEGTILSGEGFFKNQIDHALQDAEDAVRLGRVTEWVESDSGEAVPVGQKMLLVDGEEFPLLEIRKLEINLPQPTS